MEFGSCCLLLGIAARCLGPVPALVVPLAKTRETSKTRIVEFAGVAEAVLVYFSVVEGTMALPSKDVPPRCPKKNNVGRRGAAAAAAAAPRHSGEGGAWAREDGRRTRGRATATALSGAVLVLLVAGVSIL